MSEVKVRAKPFRIGQRVHVAGTTGDPHVVVSRRLSRHGIWYGFKNEAFGNIVEGYGDDVRPWRGEP